MRPAAWALQACKTFLLQKKERLILFLGGLAIITDQVCVTHAHIVTPLLEDEDGNVDKTEEFPYIRGSIRIITKH